MTSSSVLALVFALMPVGFPTTPAPAPATRHTAIRPIDAPDEPTLADGPVRVAGARVRVNGCTAMDVLEGPAGVELLALQWSQPASRRDWLQHQFDRHLARYDGDLWRAFIELGGGLRQSASGIAVEARATGAFEQCGSLELPVLEVEWVVGIYDVHDHRTLDDAADPLSETGFDAASPELAGVLEAAREARQGQVVTLELPIEGVTDRSLGCPPWALFSSDVTFDCGSRYGFVAIEYATPELAPDSERALATLLEHRGLHSLDEAGRQAEQLREQADRLARFGPYRYRGHFTGEMRLHRGTEAVFLTPVFRAEALLD